MGDTFRFHHHVVAVPEIKPADRIVHAVKKLEEAIKQQPQKAPLDEHDAITLLRRVLLGERNKLRTTLRRISSDNKPIPTNECRTTISKARTPPLASPNYVSNDDSDDEEEDQPTKCTQSPRRFSQRLRNKAQHSINNVIPEPPQLPKIQHKLHFGWAPALEEL